ncbi:MAG: alkaline phosphatase family protein [Isosphaeraceae bacterium]
MEGAVKKVFVIGLDGLSPSIVARLMTSGELPNLARLKEQGGYSTVATTRPAQTPVAWSTFATGVNPGGHGIFDFLRRNPQNYLPDLALNRYEQKNAFLPPKAVNLRGGTPIWELLKSAGRGAAVLRCPCTYPPDPIRGRLLSGMGVPDLRGGLGTATFFTTDPSARPHESENVVRLEPVAGAGAEEATYSAHLIGPRGPKGGDLRVEFTLRVDSRSGRAVLRSDGSPRELEIRRGAWSDWLRVKFKAGMLQSARGMVRFYLVACEPELQLYASPVNFDPDAPLFPISQPFEYAGDLAREQGLFSTTGMVEDHTGLNNERIPESAFLDQCEIAWRERTDMMHRELERLEDGLFYVLFDTPDRIQHLFWRYNEPDHPANRGETPDPAYAPVIDDAYRRCDAIVGQALDYADDRTLVMALSDHGFNSFRRGVDLNKCLLDRGYLALRDGVQPGEQAGDLLRQVDWSRTRAYAVGLSGIYLNLRDREGQGIVPPDEADALKAELARSLAGLADPASPGTTAIRRVLPREEAYRGAYLAEAPDLTVDFADGYRVSWSSSMGGVAEHAFEDNVKKWSGDHIIDPDRVPGILFMNRAFREGARLLDMAPTILAALGVPKGPAMEGESILR